MTHMLHRHASDEFLPKRVAGHVGRQLALALLLAGSVFA